MYLGKADEGSTARISCRRTHYDLGRISPIAYFDRAVFGASRSPLPGCGGTKRAIGRERTKLRRIPAEDEV